MSFYVQMPTERRRLNDIDFGPDNDFGPDIALGTIHFSTVVDGSAVRAARKKNPSFLGGTNGLDSEADGTRTRNLWIDSPVL
jgi:hypothetical protein